MYVKINNIIFISYKKCNFYYKIKIKILLYILY